MENFSNAIDVRFVDHILQENYKIHFISADNVQIYVDSEYDEDELNFFVPIAIKIKDNVYFIDYRENEDIVESKILHEYNIHKKDIDVFYFNIEEMGLTFHKDEIKYIVLYNNKFIIN